jgi:hypothetical protein
MKHVEKTKKGITHKFVKPHSDTLLRYVSGLFRRRFESAMASFLRGVFFIVVPWITTGLVLLCTIVFDGKDVHCDAVVDFFKFLIITVADLIEQS